MEEGYFLEKIRGVDWVQYVGPDCYRAESVEPALEALVGLPGKACDDRVSFRVLSAIGNNHRGTYYPALLSALEILLEVEANGPSDAARKCANAVLYDLCCFEPEVGDYSEIANAELGAFVEPQIRKFGDET
ncbi:MAG: hypothetical protein DHS20C11_06590 [Lysobacteraceae bacterium]|nr:MAG: hypothetical protein DHS20C11_06590 [Xanthomonadaceae bacterium]